MTSEIWMSWILLQSVATHEPYRALLFRMQKLQLPPGPAHSMRLMLPCRKSAPPPPTGAEFPEKFDFLAHSSVYLAVVTHVDPAKYNDAFWTCSAPPPRPRATVYSNLDAEISNSAKSLIEIAPPALSDKQLLNVERITVTATSWPVT